MVRKTTAVEVENTTSHQTASASEEKGFDFEALINESLKGLKENIYPLSGMVVLLIGLVLLREFLLGMILVTAGILLISGFFNKK